MAGAKQTEMTKEEKELQAKRDENQEVFVGLVEQFGEEKAHDMYENLVFAKRAKASGASLSADGTVNLDRDARATRLALRDEPHVWLTIPAMEEDPDPDGTVYVGANEQSYHIRKGVRVCVPQTVVDILKEAVVEGTVPGRDLRGNPRRVKYQRVPFSVEGPATPEEAEEFRRQMVQAGRRQPEDSGEYQLPAELQ